MEMILCGNVISTPNIYEERMFPWVRIHEHIWTHGKVMCISLLSMYIICERYGRKRGCWCKCLLILCSLTHVKMEINTRSYICDDIKCIYTPILYLSTNICIYVYICTEHAPARARSSNVVMRHHKWTGHLACHVCRWRHSLGYVKYNYLLNAFTQ